MSLEDIASKFDFPKDGGLFIILGPETSPKRNLITKPSIRVTGDDIKRIEIQLAKFLVIEHRLAKIVFDNVNPRFYKTIYFKNLLNSCKDNRLQLYIIIENMLDLPSTIRAKAEYWFLFGLNNNYLSFPPLNQLSDWREPSHDENTAIVARFSEKRTPEIWWYNSKKNVRTIKIVKSSGNNEGTTNILNLMQSDKKGSIKRSKTGSDLEKRVKQLGKDLEKLHDSVNTKFEQLFKMLTTLDIKLESIMYEEESENVNSTNPHV